MSPIRPSERTRYPPDWPAIRARILARAEGRCEFLMIDGTRCNAPDGEVIFRWRENLEEWRAVNGNDLGEGDGAFKAVTVVLTIAHLNHRPEDCRDENLLAGCQLHHLRYDREHHQRSAAATRRAHKRDRELFDGA